MIDDFWCNQDEYSLLDAGYLWLDMNPKADRTIDDRRIIVVLQTFMTAIKTGGLEVTGGLQRRGLPVQSRWMGTQSAYVSKKITIETKVSADSLRALAISKGIRPAFLFPLDGEAKQTGQVDERTMTAITETFSFIDGMDSDMVTHGLIQRFLADHGYGYGDTATFKAVWKAIPPGRKNAGGRPKKT